MAESRVNEAGVYTKPTLRKRIFQQIKAGSKAVLQVNGVLEKPNYLLLSTDKPVVDIKNEKTYYY
jgi:hypothetical protein